ncbi:MAG: hypothetical protein IH859_05685 [Chloroflexi bacterium]|nr:hypothetical protein [Chloroflexota bacterium]
MKTTQPALIFSIGLAGVSLSVGFLLVNSFSLAALATVLMGVWWIGISFSWRWLHGLELFAFWGLTVVGVLLEVGVIWLAFGLVAALAAWELGHFSRRMAAYPPSDDLEQIARRHHLRLLLVSITSIGLITAALGFQLRLPFGWAFVLALLALIGLSQAVGYLRRAGE